MIENQNIVCFAYTTWEGNFVKSIVELLSRLATKNNILFIEYPFTIKDVYKAFRGAPVPDNKRVLGISSRIRDIELSNKAHVKLLTLPPTFPYAMAKSPGQMKQILNFNSHIVRPAIKKAIHKLGFDSYILLNSFNPFYGLALWGKLNETANIYYCFDALNERRYGQTGIEIEKEYMQKCNGIICSSDHLKEVKSKSNANTWVVKNGCDYDTFSDYFHKHKKQKNNKIGYIGSLDFRFEAELVAWVASQMPDYVFEFVGRVSDPSKKEILSKIDNIQFHDPVKPWQVPEIMFNCDVGIIPYTRIEENRSIYPLKINEYLAVGTAVVRTDFADLPDFNDWCSVASTKEEFLEKIKVELASDSSKKQHERNTFAARASWDSRTESFSNALESISKT